MFVNQTSPFRGQPLGVYGYFNPPPSPVDNLSIKRKATGDPSENKENQARVNTANTPKKARVNKELAEVTQKSGDLEVLKEKYVELEKRAKSEEARFAEHAKKLEAALARSAENEKELEVEKFRSAQREKEIEAILARNAEMERLLKEQQAKFAEFLEQAKKQEEAQIKLKEALESEKLKTDAKLQAAEEENVKLKSALNDEQLRAKEYGDLVLDSFEQRMELETELTETKDKLELAELHLKQPSLFEIEELLGQALQVEATDKALAEIKVLAGGQHKLVTVGRPPVIGESKHQFAHIIPYGLIEKLAKNIIGNEHTFDRKISLLIDDLMMFYKFDKGICIKLSELKSLGLKLSTVVGRATSFYTTASDTYFLIENNYEELIQDPLKRQQAEEMFVLRKQKYIKNQLTALKQAIYDENTKHIFCEKLAIFMFTLFNKKTFAAYPSEGNISELEIRLYDDAEAALKRGSKAFTTVSTFDLKNLIAEEVDLNGKIRVVANSGSKVKEALKALSILNKIFEKVFREDDFQSTFDKYNDKYNVQIKLSSSNPNLSLYNSDLTALEQIYFHIAKQAYIMFGLKALEEVILAPTPDKKGILGYAKASGDKQVYYKLEDGVNYRAEQRKEAESKYPTLTNFRPEITNFEFLARKSVEFIEILKLTYPSFLTGFLTAAIDQESCPIKILKAFTNLIALDYQLEHNSFYATYVFPLTKSWNIDYDSDFSSEIELSGDEFISFNNVTN